MRFFSSQKKQSLVKGLSFLGVRTAHIPEMREFYLSVMGLQIKRDEPDFVAFYAPDGSRIELFGPARSGHEHFTTGPVGGFEVDDINEARDKLAAAGIKILADIGGRKGGTQWVHFKGPDGNVYEVVHHEDFKKA